MSEQREQAGVDRPTFVAAAMAATPFKTASAGRAATKALQPAARYQLMSKDAEECDACAHFAAPGACKIVDGDISPKGWCRLWTKEAA